MKTKTINISLPPSLYAEAKKHQKEYHYTSISEMIRDALRWWLNPRLTRNGFTPEFEKEIIEAEKEADAGSVVEWDGKTPFGEFVLSHPPPPPLYDKNRIRRKVLQKLSKTHKGSLRTYQGSQQTYPMV